MVKVVEYFYILQDLMIIIKLNNILQLDLLLVEGDLYMLLKEIFKVNKDMATIKIIEKK